MICVSPAAGIAHITERENTELFRDAELRQVEEGLLSTSNITVKHLKGVNFRSLERKGCGTGGALTLDGRTNGADLVWSNPALTSGINHEGRLRFRSLRPSDKDSIKALHEEWFPVSYKDEFYECVVHNKMSGTGDPLFSCVACTEKEPDIVLDDSGIPFGSLINERESRRIGNIPPCLDASSAEDVEDCCPGMASSEISAFVNQHGSEQENDSYDDDTICDRTEPGLCDRSEKIVGCIVGAFLDAERCNKEVSSLLLSNPDRYSRLFYIMTLGTISERRKQGLGSSLVEKCVEVAKNDSSCGVVYLHVITFNKAAIKFYEKLGFYRVKEIEDYYSIEGKHYNCYLYARYLNGNRGHLSLLQLVTNLVHSFWKRISSPLYAVLSHDVRL